MRGRKGRLTPRELMQAIDESVGSGKPGEQNAFTRTDLLAMARRLKIDEDLLDAAFDEHVEVVEKYLRRPAEPRPEGSQVELAMTPLFFDLALPRARFPIDRSGVVLGTLLVGFVLYGFEFQFASTLSIVVIGFFTLLLVLFLAIPLALSLRSAHLFMNRDVGELQITGLWKSRHRFETRNLRIRKQTYTATDNERNVGGSVLQLNHVKGKHDLMQSYTEEEIDWVIAEFRRWSGEEIPKGKRRQGKRRRRR